MKNSTSYLLFSTLFFILNGITYGQEACSDLFFSELVFASNQNDLESSSVKNNFNSSIEIYNPTESSINLNNYIIRLHSLDADPTDIIPSGFVPSDEVFVISNSNATEEIVTETDMFYEGLDFSFHYAIELINNDTNIDKVGSSNQSIDDFDISSLQNLSIQRSRLLKHGNPVFMADNFFEEWKVSPNTNLDDLGFHVNACNASILFWDGVNSLEPDFEVQEEFANLIVNGS